ncbi:MAG TPA: hypothetical protein VEZ42_05565 [Pseudonocardia sp.]|nr:hypothetical protein [Pseudonocardia sp.]
MLLTTTYNPVCSAVNRCSAEWKALVSPPWPMTSRPLTFDSKKPSRIRFSGGTTSSAVSCICAAVSGRRIRRSSSSPSCRWASMNRPMSAALADIDPAGPTPMISKGTRSPEASR